MGRESFITAMLQRFADAGELGIDWIHIPALIRYELVDRGHISLINTRFVITAAGQAANRPSQSGDGNG